MLEGKGLRENEGRTRVALSNPANVSPTRIDNSSVANAKSCGVRRTRLMIAERVGPNVYEPLRGA